MNISSLDLKNIGPFKEAHLEFATRFNPENGEQPVTIITGVNGAGKSIVIDAIRTVLAGQQIERDIVADENDFKIEIGVEYNGENKKYSATKRDQISSGFQCVTPVSIYWPLKHGIDKTRTPRPFVMDYWSAKLPTDPFKISNMTAIAHEKALKDVLLGKKSNVDLVNFICNIDYLRSSEMPEEKEKGNAVYDEVKRIVKECLDKGEFKYVRRSDLTPVVEQNGVELTLEKLSSGNIFLIEQLLLLLGKMYSVGEEYGLKASEMFNLGGVLLIDEIETHLHPFWQKKIVGIIRKLFPNLQIILTTHSPFVVASVDGARIYTAKPETGYSVLNDETEKYSHMPVDEILASDVFGVAPFNDSISALMEKRDKLLDERRTEEAREVERELYEINPQYFAYMGLLLKDSAER